MLASPEERQAADGRGEHCQRQGCWGRFEHYIMTQYVGAHGPVLVAKACDLDVAWMVDQQRHMYAAREGVTVWGVWAERRPTPQRDTPRSRY